MWNVLNILKRISGVKTAQVAITNEPSPEKDQRPSDAPEFDPAEQLEMGPYKQRKFHLTIEWDPPSISYMDPISEAQCSAEVRDYYHGKPVEGNYFYYPPIGTILEAGIHDIKLTFVPQKTFKYNSLEATRKLEVKKKRAEVTWNYDGGYISFTTPLTKAHLYNGLQCALTEGTYEFSHVEGTILEVGVHRVTACYLPGPEEQRNYTRGYATAEIQVIGTIVPIHWTLPIDVRSMSPGEIPGQYRLMYPCRLPHWVYSAECGLPGVEGEYHYSIGKEVILPVGYHEIEVTFHPVDTRKYFPTPARQTVYIHPGTVHLTWPRPFSNPQGEPLDETVLNCSNTLQIPGHYEYQPGPGTVLPIGEHTLHCTFHPENTNYLPASMSVPYKILDKRLLNILWFPPEEITHPMPLDDLQLNAKLIGFGARERGRWVYDPPAGTVLDSGEQTLTTTFYPEKATYHPARASVTIMVHQATARLIWKQPEPVYTGERLYDTVMNCVCTNVSRGTFTYTPGKGHAFLEPGTFPLRVSFIPDDVRNYLPAETKTKIVVNPRPKILPTLRWTNPVSPTPLDYGQKLSERYLSAVCVNARGFFLYDPPEGSILPAGIHTLTATFDPDDPSSCLSGTVTSTIIILRKYPVLRWVPVVDDTYQLTYGELLTAQNYLTAFATYSDSDRARIPGVCTYTPSPDTILESGDRTLTCTFTPQDLHNYYPLVASRQIFVRRRVPDLSWDIPSQYFPLHYPVALRTLPPPKVMDDRIAGQFFYSVDMTEYLPQGNHIITATFSPHDIINYLGNSLRKEIEILPTLPVVLWNPLVVTFPYETKLAKEVHCNASSPLPGGSFLFAPPIGTLLEATSHLSDQDAVDDLLDTTLLSPGPISGPTSPARDITPDPTSSMVGEGEGEGRSGKKMSLEELQGGETAEQYPGLIPRGKILVKLTYLPADPVNYQQVVLTRFFTVVKKSPVLSWHYPWKLSFGTPLTAKNVLKATLSTKENSTYALEQLAQGTFVYCPGPGTLLPAGKNREVVVTFTPPPEQARNYTSATRTAYIEVLKTAPRMTWKPKVLTLFEGNALTHEHLNAMVQKRHVYKGQLLYDPPLGTVLAPGRYNIEVKFVPAEPQNVLPKSLTRTFQVIKNTPKIAWEPDPMSGEMKMVKLVE